MRVGLGYDVHRLKTGRKLIIGGVDIPHEKGLDGHSDADVLLHAITDALLGAAALGDIGTFFPDTDSDFKNIDSRLLLREAVKMVHQKGYLVANIDATIVAERPKLMPYIHRMIQCISSDLEVQEDQVMVKATTSEKMGMIGREEGISAMSICLLTKG